MIKFYLFTLTFLLFSTFSFGKETTIVLSSLEWPPYVGKKLPNEGYIADFVREVFKDQGLKLKITYYPWARGLKEAENGNTEGIFPEYYSLKRAKKFNFSMAIPGGPMGFYKIKNNPITFKDLEDLKTYRIGIVRGYVNTKEFDDAGYLKKIESTNDFSNLRMLFHKRVDLVVIDKYVAKYLIEKNEPKYEKVMEFMEPALELKPLYIAFSKNGKQGIELIKKFNTGALKLIRNGTVNKILLSHGLEKIDTKKFLEKYK